MMMKRFLAATFVLATCLSASSSYAIGPAGIAVPNRTPQSISVKTPTLAPFAYVKYCVENAGDCAKSDAAGTVTVTPKDMRQLRQVNIEVNRSIVAQYDAPGADRWEADVAAGDCEDFVLTKRRHLMALGWSPNALRVAVVYTLRGEGHAVLVVSTSKGDLVLDNRNNSVLNWRDTDLRWVMIQSSTNPLFWNKI